MTGQVPRVLLTAALAAALAGRGGAQAPPPVPGLTAADEVATTYSLILDAGFAALPARLAATCGPAPSEACLVLGAVAVQWRMLLDPADRDLDATLEARLAPALDATAAWVAREPARAEAWFYQGAAYGVRVQWHVLRGRRVAAARDGKRVREAMARTLALDPGFEDARFGQGMYEYYAGVAPTVLKWFRWLLLLPGGDRADGLRLIQAARDHARVVAPEADYQMHLIDLWYEGRFTEGLEIIRTLEARFPHAPLFRLAEASILDVYFHDAEASLAAYQRLLNLTRAGEMHEASLAAAAARLGIATQLVALDRREEARPLLEALVAERPAAPADTALRAARLLATLPR
ncbi:MAG: hypothetical protein AB7O67_06130 [Vicinamibacterales bacterium]